MAPNKVPGLAVVRPSDYQPRMIASELITAIQRCALGDKEQLQAASELSTIFIAELHQLLVFRPNMQAQVFRQVLPAVQRFLSRRAVVDAANGCPQTLANANKLLAAASSFVALSKSSVERRSSLSAVSKLIGAVVLIIIPKIDSGVHIDFHRV